MPQFLYAWQARSFCSFFTKMNCDPRKTVGLKKRDSLKCAGASQQTLEQRSSLWNWPRMKQEINRLYVHCSIAEHTFMTAQQLLGIIPQLSSTCLLPASELLCKTTVITCHCRGHCGYMTSKMETRLSCSSSWTLLVCSARNCTVYIIHSYQQ